MSAQSILEVSKEEVNLEVVWKISDFLSYDCGTRLESDIFGENWSIVCYPNGFTKKCSDSVAIYLRSKVAIFVSFELSILDRSYNKYRSKRIEKHFFRGNYDRGFHQHSKIIDIIKSTEDLLTDGILFIGCTIKSHIENKPLLGTFNVFKNILFSAAFSDVELIVEGKSFPAHKCLLASRSPVFRAMFSQVSLENCHNKVNILNFEFDVFAEMIVFIYTNECPNLKVMPEKLYYAAEKYQITGLIGHCISHMMNNISVKKTCTRYLIACKSDKSSMKSLYSEVAQKHFEEVVFSADYDVVSKAHPEVIKDLIVTVNKLSLTHSLVKHEPINSIKEDKEVAHNLLEENKSESAAVAH